MVVLGNRTASRPRSARRRTSTWKSNGPTPSSRRRRAFVSRWPHDAAHVLSLRFRDVNYANLVRPPNEVYGQALCIDWKAGSQLSPADQIHDTDRGRRSPEAVSWTRQSRSGADFKNVRGLNAKWETEWVTLRAGRVWGHPQLAPGHRPEPSPASALRVDRNNIVVQSEYVTRRSECCASSVNANGWYALAGYRFNPFLPYVSYAKAQDPLPAIPLDQSAIHSCRRRALGRF